MSEDVYMDFEMLRTAPAAIMWPRMYGYFFAEVKGVPSIANIPHEYMHVGPLSLSYSGAPLQF